MELTTPYRYIRKIDQLSDDLIALQNKRRVQARRQMVDILQTNGVARSTTSQLQGVVSDLGSRIIQDRYGFDDQLLKSSQSFINDQRNDLLKVGVNTPVPPSNYNPSSAFSDLLLTEPQWIQAFGNRIGVTMTRAIAEDQPVTMVQDRLFGTQFNDGRASAYRLSGSEGKMATDTSTWVAALAVVLVLSRAYNEISQITFQKQAIAAIDHRTTDCCLRVHGQIQKLDGKFILRGTPRFANKLKSPPFHWHCRTIWVLYTPELEGLGTTTEEMISAATAEIKARKEEGRSRIWPAHATSRRRK